MFSFFIRRSKVIIDCFTQEATFALYPPSRAIDYIPSWWKNIPKDMSSKNVNVGYIPLMTMKGCSGFIDYYSNGFVLPLWSDLIISTEKDSYGYVFCNNNCSASEHPAVQHNFSLDYHHLKLNSPWWFKSKSNINFHWSSCLWSTIKDTNLTSGISILPGVINFYNQNTTNLNLFLQKTTNRYELNVGLPLVYLFPQTEKNVEFRTHVVTDVNLIKNFYYFNTSFKNNYYKNKTKAH